MMISLFLGLACGAAFEGGSRSGWTELSSAQMMAWSCIVAVMTATDGLSASCDKSAPNTMGLTSASHPGVPSTPC